MSMPLRIASSPGETHAQEEYRRTWRRGSLRVGLPEPTGSYIVRKLGDNRIEVPSNLDYILEIENLAVYHRDPFDRILIAQAIAEPAFLYTADQRLSPYSELVRQIDAG